MAADDARPAPTGNVASTAAESRRPDRRARRTKLSRKEPIRSDAAPWTARPFCSKTDTGDPIGVASTRAVAVRSARVTEMLPTAGRFKRASRLPQYLTRATFAQACATAALARFPSLIG